MPVSLLDCLQHPRITVLHLNPRSDHVSRGEIALMPLLGTIDLSLPLRRDLHLRKQCVLRVMSHHLHLMTSVLTFDQAFIDAGLVADLKHLQLPPHLLLELGQRVSSCVIEVSSLDVHSLHQVFVR